MSKQQIILLGNSRGAKHGEKRSVEEERAKELVDLGLAKYPPNSKAAAEQKPQ